MIFELKEIVNYKLSNEILDKEIKPDFYFAIYSLTKYLEQLLLDNLEKQINKNLFYDKEVLIKNIAGQINFHVKEKLLALSLVHELEIAKKADIISGSSGKKRFEYFIKNITNNKEWIEYYFEKYPLLADRLQTLINNILQHVYELFSRLDKDIKIIRNELLTQEKSKIETVILFCGDPHKKGKSVCIISFANNNKIVYKPRDLNNEIKFQHFVDYLNNIGSKLNLGFVKIISKDKYSWMEYIEYRETNSISEIESYFHTMGQSLCLFHLLGTYDIMPDNMILQCRTPYFIDLECLLNKPIKNGYSRNIIAKIAQSVITIGILPYWAFNNSLNRDILRSVLYSINKQKITGEIWINKGTDNVKQKKQNINKKILANEKHLPKYKGETFELNYEYLKKFKEGFLFQYNFFLNHKGEILNALYEKDFFQNLFMRVVIHETVIYELLLKESIIPEYLEGKKDISLVVEKMVQAAPKPSSNSIKKAVIKQLYCGDIPYFFTYNSSSCLYDSDGNYVSKNYYDAKKNATYMIEERLTNFSREDLAFQMNIIDISCIYSFEVLGKEFKKEVPFIDIKKVKSTSRKSNKNVLDKNQLLYIAHDIGLNIFNKSYYNSYSKEYNWIWKSRDIDGRWGALPFNLDFYDGLSGMSYLFLYLYKYTGEKNFLTLAETLFRRMEETFFKMINHFHKLPLDVIETTAVSPFSYPFSLVYLMDHFSSILGVNYWNEKLINETFAILDKYLMYSKRFDVFLGQTGTLLLLLSIENRIINNNGKCGELMKKCISNLYYYSEEVSGSCALPYIDHYDIERRKLFIGGFSHGSAGLAAILLRYAKLKNDMVAQYLGFEALKHDRAQYIPEINGWRDGRDGLEKYDSGCWCHGSGGVALSRILISHYFNDSNFNEELKIAKRNILNIGIGGNQSLCHGDLGNLEILLAIGRNIKDPHTIDFVNKYLNCLINEYKKGKSFKTGEVGKIPLLNLFMGTAGVAYGFLRQYDWENTPSILSLESSNLEFHKLHF